MFCLWVYSGIWYGTKFGILSIDVVFNVVVFRLLRVSVLCSIFCGCN